MSTIILQITMLLSAKKKIILPIYFIRRICYTWYNDLNDRVIILETNISANKFKILSGSMLKLLAVISMTVDHTAAILVSELDVLRTPFSIGGRAFTLYYIMRMIGRLAFPIFCFLITEGFVHTRDKKRYGLRLLIFAVISEIPFNLLHGGSLVDLTGQNVFFTLFLGLLMIYAFEVVSGEFKKFLVISAIGVITTLLKADYGLYGVLLVFVIYLFRNAPAVQALLAYPLLSSGLAAWAAFVPINMYNGQRGFIKTPLLKYAFYAFYPLHILLLAGIKYLI